MIVPLWSAILALVCGLAHESYCQAPSHDSLDALIRAHRMGTLTIMANEGSTVRLSQIRHAFPFGTAISRKAFNGEMGVEASKKYLDTLARYFNAAVHENILKWPKVEPELDNPDYSLADTVYEWCARQGIRMRGHAIFWERKDWGVPSWSDGISDDRLREKIKERAVTVTSRYRDKITEFDVDNEMLHYDYYRSRLGAAIQDSMFVWALEGNPEAALYFNDFDVANGSGGYTAYRAQIQGFLDRGIVAHGIGCQGHIFSRVNQNESWKALNYLAETGLPIRITEFDVVGAGEDDQAGQMEQFLRLCFAHPAVNGFLFWGFWEGKHWRTNAGLWNLDWTPRSAARRYRELVFDEWWSDTTCPVPVSGQFDVRLYYGTYAVTINGEIADTIDFNYNADGTAINMCAVPTDVKEEFLPRKLTALKPGIPGVMSRIPWGVNPCGGNRGFLLSGELSPEEAAGQIRIVEFR